MYDISVTVNDGGADENFKSFPVYFTAVAKPQSRVVSFPASEACQKPASTTCILSDLLEGLVQGRNKGLRLRP